MEFNLCGKAKDLTSAPKAIETGAGDGRSFTAQRREAKEKGASGTAAEKAHAQSRQHAAGSPSAEKDGRQGARREGGRGQGRIVCRLVPWACSPGAHPEGSAAKRSASQAPASDAAKKNPQHGAAADRPLAVERSGEPQLPL